MKQASQATLVGAGSPANTGKAGAMHRVVFFAGKPAPTGAAAPA
ncbi:sensory box protein [Pseudomonas putida]|nr:sensory box protein [Pseudomonas putida]